MKKIALAVMADTVLVLGAAPSSEAGGFRGDRGFKGHGGLHRRFGLRCGFTGHGFHGHPGFGTKSFIGAPLHGQYGFRASPYFSARAFAGQAAPNYVQQEGAVSYYCGRARAYYPDVQECPDGLVTVSPPATTSPSKESWE